MRRLVSIPIALLMSLLIVSTAFAAFCGNESKPQGSGQHSTQFVNLVTGEITIEGGNAAGKVIGGFVDVYLDVDGDGTDDCFINDTYFISEHSGHIAPGQNLFDLAVLPAVHRFENPGGGGAGAGFAELTALTAVGCQG